MITYEGKVNNYYYDKKIAKELREYIDCFYDNDFYTNDQITNDVNSNDLVEILGKINNFLNKITVKEEIETMQRNETQQEAKEYFGEEFVTQLENIYNKVKDEGCCIYLHGTNSDSAENIIKQGLSYHNTRLLSTAISIPFTDDGEIDYEKLLNWPHLHHKALVIVALPKDVATKGLWTDEEDLGYKLDHNNIYGQKNYVITPDFVYGFIDVTNKKIIINDKYSKDHDYSNKRCDDMEYIGIFRNKELGKSSLKKAIKSMKQDNNVKSDYVEESINISNSRMAYYKLSEAFEELRILFCMLEESEKDYMNSYKYAYNLKIINDKIKIINKVIEYFDKEESIDIINFDEDENIDIKNFR